MVISIGLAGFVGRAMGSNPIKDLKDSFVTV
jgi:hypothetical protein